MTRASVAIAGISGTSGGELARLLTGHPGVEIAAVAGSNSAGSSIEDVHPYLAGTLDLEIVDVAEIPEVDVAFLALPHGSAAEIAPPLLERGTRVIDLSGDFRLDAADYPTWYGFEHPHAAWLDKSVSGLTELHRAEIRDAALVANPGCFPTAALLGLVPLVERGLIDASKLRIDAKTGLSGAGRSLSDATSYLATEDSVRPYRFPTHQHTPEIERGLSSASGSGVAVSFVPHLVPAVRGVLTTSYADVTGGVTTEDLAGVLREAYAGEPFVRVLARGEMADTKRVRGSNVVELQAVVDERTSTAIVVGALDNLVKGAAGQAIQNLNVMLGIEETTALPTVGVYP